MYQNYLQLFSDDNIELVKNKICDDYCCYGIHDTELLDITEKSIFSRIISDFIDKHGCPDDKKFEYSDFDIGCGIFNNFPIEEQYKILDVAYRWGEPEIAKLIYHLWPNIMTIDYSSYCCNDDSNGYQEHLCKQKIRELFEQLKSNLLEFDVIDNQNDARLCPRNLQSVVKYEQAHMNIHLSNFYFFECFAYLPLLGEEVGYNILMKVMMCFLESHYQMLFFGMSCFVQLYGAKQFLPYLEDILLHWDKHCNFNMKRKRDIGMGYEMYELIHIFDLNGINLFDGSVKNILHKYGYSESEYLQLFINNEVNKAIHTLTLIRKFNPKEYELLGKVPKELVKKICQYLWSSNIDIDAWMSCVNLTRKRTIIKQNFPIIHQNNLF